jgi:hypothetical protein
MIGSTTPVAEQPDWHPVHRANAMLRAALLSSALPADLAWDPQSAESLSHAIDSVMQGPLSISFPEPLASRLDALGLEDAFPAFETLMGEVRQEQARPGKSLNGVLPDVGDDDFGEMDALTADAPLDPERGIGVPQLHVQTLLDEFRRRQRQASMLVAGSIATAVLLTVGGLWLVAHLAAPQPGDSDNRHLLRSTSIAWQKPAHSIAESGLQGAAVLANRAAKGEPLLVPALAPTRAASPAVARPQAQTILAASGRQIAFASLLPPSHAGYFLIRGLPVEAKLSAGRLSDSGAWLVKAEHAHALTLSVDAVADGDYPIEVYVLQSGDSPQARRSLVLRVEPLARSHVAASSEKDWTSALLDLVPAASAAEAPVVPADTGALHERARRLLAEGDIAAARLLLLYLAERGEGEAAYELGRTFDRDMLAELGARGIDGDLARARGWYQRAAQDGNTKAAERLKRLASLSGPGPSD